MAQRHALPAEERTIKGKEVKKIRREGRTPGIIYGGVIPKPVSVSVEAKELERLYYGYGTTTLIDLQVNGTTYVVYMRNVEMDRLKRAPSHAEFYAPNLGVAITASVPILLVGEVSLDDAVVTQGHATVEVRGLPEALPSSLEADLTSLTEIDQSLYVRDLRIPEGVKLLTDPDEMVVKLSGAQLVTEAELEAEAAITEGAAAARDAETAEAVASSAATRDEAE